jgi:nitrate/nitrite transporter NarK
VQFLRDLWGGLTDRLSQEPVMVLAVVQMGVALAVSFGLGLTAEQTGTIVAFAAAILGLIARTQVSPAAPRS